MKRARYIISFTVVVICLSFLIVSTSYALLKGSSSDENTQLIKAGSIQLELTESYDSISNKIAIMTDENGLLQDKTYNFSIKNVGDASAFYELKLVNDVPSSYDVMYLI